MAVTVIGHVVATSFLLDTSAGRPGRDSAKLSAAEDVQRASVDVYCRQSSRNRHVTTSARLVVCWHSSRTKWNFFFPKNQKEKWRMCRRGGRRRAKENKSFRAISLDATHRQVFTKNRCFRFAPPGPPPLLAAPGSWTR